MSEAAAAFKNFGRAMAAAHESANGRMVDFTYRVNAERRAVDAVAEWLAEREGSPCFRGRGVHVHMQRAEFRRRAAAVLAGQSSALPTTLGDLDDEVFCPDCFAGMESSEHHEKCEGR